MKHCLLILIIVTTSISFGQLVKDSPYSKGNWYAYWGWNRAAYTTSDIHFKGDYYDFTLYDVIAKDRQSAFDPKLYFGPTTMTIPQYNFRIGYFFHDKYNISFGADHMKYVLSNNTYAKIDGYIENSGTKYDGNYSNEDILLAPDFILFEHTDGLNYENIEVRRFDVVLGRKQIALAFNEGLGVGVLVPRTNATILNNERYDQFHLAGYGFGAILSANLTFFQYFFVQMEWKGGFIHMPDIRTTKFKSDRASQHFWYSQYNVVFGGVWRFKQKNQEAKITKSFF